MKFYSQNYEGFTKCFIPVIIGVFFLPVLFSSTVHAETITLDKQNYVFGDEIKISGKMIHSEGNFIGLQIIAPHNSDIVVLDQFFPQRDGSFSKSYKAQGPKWSENGIYSVRIVYDEQTFEKTLSFKKTDDLKTDPKTPFQDKDVNQTKTIPSFEITPLNPKLRVEGFPDPLKTPNYYLARYSNEPEYRDWFNTTFRDFTIDELVGYKRTHIEGFPDYQNSPWYYVERYNKEEIYRDWFDSQFPSQSIYDVLGYPEEFFLKVPSWVKNNAGWWASGMITDSDFLSGISYLINEGILTVPALIESESLENQNVPLWVKNTAKWWAEGKIDENEFLKGIQFLVENKIIKV